MTELLGYQTILTLALPTGADGAKLAEWELRSGRSYSQIVADVAASMAGLNQEFMDRWDWLFFLTTEQMMEYPQGGTTTESPVTTDTDNPESIHQDTISHMLQLLVHSDAFGGSKRFFRDMREAQLIANVRGITDRLRKRFEKDLLRRLFTNTEYSIGTSGYDVPFVRGTGGNVDFAPPSYDGEDFTTSHDHYNGYDSGTYGYGTMLNAMIEHLQEHGHEPSGSNEADYTAIVSRSNVSNWYALPDFVRPIKHAQDIDRGTTTANTGAAFFTRSPRNRPGLIGWYESEYGSVEVLATARVPSGFAAAVKSYGRNTQQNPLAIRYHPDEGFGVKLVPELTIDNQWPLKKLVVEMEYGVGVGMDRTNASIGYLVAGGVWANPTIT